jgi:hypothetical protein
VGRSVCVGDYLAFEVAEDRAVLDGLSRVPVCMGGLNGGVRSSSVQTPVSVGGYRLGPT